VKEPEADEIRQLGFPVKLEKETTYFLLCSKWWNQWESYAGFEAVKQAGVERPGPIDHADFFFTSDRRLKTTVREDTGHGGL
jgi:hypothetical protein